MNKVKITTPKLLLSMGLGSTMQSGGVKRFNIRGSGRA
jgi:hypothetical protein